MSKIQYLLDSNIFIEASRKYYHFDICPGFWTTLIDQHRSKRVFSIEQVKKEITPQKVKKNSVDSQDEGENELSPTEYDAFAVWVRDHTPKSFFAPSGDLFVPKSYAEIIKTVYATPQYTEEAKAEFARVADSWLIAYAHAHNMTLVTHENNSPTSKKRVLIPVVCKQFDIPVVTVYEMLLELKIKFFPQKSDKE